MNVCPRVFSAVCKKPFRFARARIPAGVLSANWIFASALAALLSVSAASAFAQEPQIATGARTVQPIAQQKPAPKFSHINLGLFWGRSGAANGPSGYLEFDPMRWFGVGLFASDSSGEKNMYGGRAYGWSFTGGLLLAIHPPKVKGFEISPFAQVGFNHDHGRLIIPLGIPGVYWKDGDNPERYTWTVGPSISRQLFRNGPSWEFRVGKNFGPVTAAQHGGGLFAVGGLVFPLDHPLALAKSFVRF